MTKLAYLDCPTGIAGDMCLGALVNAGVPLAYLTAQLNGLGIIGEYELKVESVHRNGQQATKVEVRLTGKLSSQRHELPVMSGQSDHSHTEAVTTDRPEAGCTPNHSHNHAHGHSDPASHHDIPTAHSSHATRHLPEIEQMIQAAGLPPRAAAWSLAVFRQLAVAEGAVHGIPAEQVHFHEVGAVDAIVDIVGTCLGLDWLGIDALYCSALPTGGGTIRAAHGRLPVPVPAVLKLYELRQVPIYSNGIDRELVTPTGAAIATTLAQQFGAPPAMTLHKTGLGAGSIDLPIPNILRLWIGEEITGRAGESMSHHHPHTYTPSYPDTLTHPQQSITVLETQIDDLNPQAIGYVFEALFAVGALDVFTQAIGMKKSRPGILLTVICLPEVASACEAVLFRETSTLGIRHSAQQRTILNRAVQSVVTPYGTVRVKVAWQGDRTSSAITNIQPEYEDCAQIARQHNLAWREVHRMALQSWNQQTELASADGVSISR